jgi:hypothetical protein
VGNVAVMAVCRGKQGIMKYIKEIDAEEFNKALLDYFDYATKEDYWEVKGLFATDNDICYKTVNDNAYYIFQKDYENFAYFAKVKGNLQTINGLWEVFYDLVCKGNPFIRILGKEKRYPKILKGFTNFVELEMTLKGQQQFVWYAGHPDNIEKIKKRIARNSN